MNFFQLINTIEVKEGAKIRFYNNLYEYNDQGGWSNHPGSAGYRIPNNACEDGWEEFKVKKLISGIDALKHVIAGGSVRIMETMFWFDSDLGWILDGDGNKVQQEMAVFNTNELIFEIVDSIQSLVPEAKLVV